MIHLDRLDGIKCCTEVARTSNPLSCPPSVKPINLLPVRFPFRVPAYYALILRSLTVLEGLALQADPK